jgi:UrcA family protein
MTRSIKALLVGLAMAGVTMTASAAHRQEITVKKALVEYGDLNLQGDADAATLLGRLSKAARKVCASDSHGPINFLSRREEFSCRGTALRDAVATVDHPVLTALYQSKHGEAQLKLASR